MVQRPRYRRALRTLVALSLVQPGLWPLGMARAATFSAARAPLVDPATIRWVPAADINKNDRQASVLVLHYTVSSLEGAFAHYQQGHVSAHYTVDRDGQIYQHVDEKEAAHHAGLSFWHRTSVNQASIGIEIVNDGPLDACATLNGGPIAPGCMAALTWDQFPQAQQDSVIALCRDVLARHPIDAFDVVGHADVAPRRKEDPGPAFFWRRLAEAGVGVAYDAEAEELVHGSSRYAIEVREPCSDAACLYVAQTQLAALGYDVDATGQLDEATARVLQAINSHYLARFDAALSADTAAVIDGLWRWRGQRMGR